MHRVIQETSIRARTLTGSATTLGQQMQQDMLMFSLTSAAPQRRLGLSRCKTLKAPMQNDRIKGRVGHCRHIL